MSEGNDDNESPQSDAARARSGGIVDPVNAEAAGHGMRMNPLAREQIAVFAPIGACGPIDCVATNDAGACVPVQMKAIPAGGLTIWTK